MIMERVRKRRRAGKREEKNNAPREKETESILPY
jgi:hypothetical protein